MGDEGGGSLISPDGVVLSRIVFMSAFDIFPCSIKSRRFLLPPAHPGSCGKEAVKQLCVCVCVCVCVCMQLSVLHMIVHMFIFRYESWRQTQTCYSCKNGVCLLFLIDMLSCQLKKLHSA